MTKADLKLDELPDSFAADTKWCNFVRNRDIELGLFSWTEEDEDEDGYIQDQDDYCLVCLGDYFACTDEWGIPQWFKISADEFLDALEKLDDDQDCKIIYCRWHDGSRQEEYWLKPIACNDKWVYFDLHDQNSVIKHCF